MTPVRAADHPIYAVAGGNGTLNLSGAITQFQVVGQPGAMTGYFAQGGSRCPTR
ncbi:MAG TPA: hypothetical protein VGJ19_14005 [Streptosporangiaceae bacterium]